MSEEKRPVYPPAGVIERCGHCGADVQDEHPGHGFEAQTWPALPAEADVEFRSDVFRAVDDRGDKLTVDARHLATNLVGRAAMWRGSALSMVRPVASTEEWTKVRRAALLMLARLLCPHVDQQVWAGIARLTDVEPTEQEPMPPTVGYHLDIRAWCSDCGEPFVFVGDQLPVGVSPGHPTVDVEGTTLSAPLRPLQYPEDWGLDRAGYQVRVR